MSELKQPRSRDEWLFGFQSGTFMSKAEIADYYVRKLLLKTQRIFKYTGLPNTISQKDLELLLQCNGSATIAKVDGELYAFRGQLGGVPNAYYLPTISIVANPYLRFNAELEIDKDCVVILNDALYIGLLPTLRHNAYLLAECDISFKFACINNRIPAIVNAPNDNTKKEAEEFFRQIEEGDELGVIADTPFIDRLNVYNYANSSTLVQHLIELKQYIYGTLLHDIGILSSYNMKREAINSTESGMSEDILFPLVSEMLEQRKIGVKKINDMFGTNITVELDNVWLDHKVQREQEFELVEKEIDSNNQENTEINKEEAVENE